MSGLGQKQPLNSIPILASERLLSGYTGHSPLLLLGGSSGWFRPIAVVGTLLQCTYFRLDLVIFRYVFSFRGP